MAIILHPLRNGTTQSEFINDLASWLENQDFMNYSVNLVEVQLAFQL